MHLTKKYKEATRAQENVSGEPQYNTDGFSSLTKYIEAFGETVEKVGEDIHDAFANIINKNLRRKPSDKTVLETAEKYSRSNNVPNLTVPKTSRTFLLVDGVAWAEVTDSR